MFILWDTKSLKAAFLEWSGYKDSTLISGIIEEMPEYTLAHSLIWGHSEKTAVYAPRNGFSPDIKSAGGLILDFPDPEL